MRLASQDTEQTNHVRVVMHGELIQLGASGQSECYSDLRSARPIPWEMVSPPMEQFSNSAAIGGSETDLRALAVAYLRRGETAAALVAAQQAVALHPDDAKVLHTLVAALHANNRNEEALAACRRVIQLQPDWAEPHRNLGMILMRQGKPDEAIASLERAVALQPGFAEAWNSLGTAYRAVGRFADAAEAHTKAIHLKPSLAEAINNLGNDLQRLGHFDEAIARYDEALRVRPNYPKARYNRSLALLAAGDYERGWVEYEWRQQCLIMPPAPQLGPPWDGSPLNGQFLLLQAEQGIGDTIQFLRYAAGVRERGGRVVLHAPRRLLPLLGTCPWIDAVAEEETPPPACATYIPALSLPRVFGTTLATIPAAVPYLTASPERVQHWRERLSNQPGFKIGIAWRGSPTHGDDRFRSIPLHCFERLARIDGVSLISLQRGPGQDEVAQVAERFPIVDLGPGVDEAGAFLDTAAVLKCVDLAIVCDSAVAHVAGALGVPIWLALSAAPDWRWLVGREDTPWYPTMRLFRQKTIGEWAGAFERMAGDLGRMP